MKKQFSPLIAIFALIMAVFASCKSDELEVVTPPEKEKPGVVTEKTVAEQQKEAVLEALSKNSDLSEFAKEFENLDLKGIDADKFIIFAVPNSGMQKTSTKSSGNDGINIKRHLSTSNNVTAKLSDGINLKAFDGSTLSITEAPFGGYVYVNEVEIEGEKIIADNSVIYIVENILPAAVTPMTCGDDMYFYDKTGNRTSIEHLFLNNYLVVGFRQGDAANIQKQLSEIESFINRTDYFKPIDWSIGRSTGYSNTDIIHIELWLMTKERKTCEQLNEIILELKKEPSVSYVHPAFKTYLTFSPVFYVVTDNISELNDITQETNTTIIQEWQDFYTVLADKNSVGNALQMANYFYETGKFINVFPAFWNEPNPNVPSSTGTSKITMISQAPSVTIDIAGVGDLVINWGDGTIENHQLFNQRFSAFSRHTHNYSGNSAHTITLSGDDILELDCYNNQLTVLDVSSAPQLTFLYCGYNQLTYLNVNSNTELTYLALMQNQIKDINVSRNSRLTTLMVSSNLLTSLDVSNNPLLTGLYIGYNQITAFDVSNNTRLQWLSVTSNQLKSLNLKNNTGLIELLSENNQLSAAAMNEMLGSLHDNSVPYIWKRVHIGNNPGTNSCNPDIAKNKGWEVFNNGTQIY